MAALATSVLFFPLEKFDFFRQRNWEIFANFCFPNLHLSDSANFL
jgi:hypothetical protein